MALAGLDVGTTGCKVTVYSDDGAYLFRSYCDYPVSRSTGEHEVKAEYIWEGVKKVIREAAGAVSDLTAIGITSFGETCVLLDVEDRPVRPAMLYTDPRGEEECRELIDRLGRETIQRITGVNPHNMYSLPKLMWIRKHCPDEYAGTVRILMIEDYITYMLTGTAFIDHSLAARSMAFDIEKLTWSSRMFDASGIDQKLFSKPVPGGTSAGTLKKEVAVELGLPEDVIIVPTGHDQVAAALGSGVFETDVAVDGAGTVECITPVFDGIPRGQKMSDGNYAIVPYVIPGKYVTYAFSFTGGALVSWFINNLAKEEQRRAQEQNKTVYEILEAKMKDEPSGILVLPHFAGAGTPHMDPQAEGAVIGLKLEHSTSDLYRAMMEGVVYEMMLNMECLAAAGISPKHLRATGGGAASAIWMQMKADALNLPVTALGNADAGAVGCAMMAGIAAEIFPNLQTAAEKLIQEKHVYHPRAEQHQKYTEHYQRYRKLYQAVRPIIE